MRVLIAHADAADRDRLGHVVTRGRRLPLEILTVGDGPEALDLLLAEDPPEVALVDWDLPGIEAPEMCRLVRDFHQHHDTWIIVLTSQAHQESAREVWRAGADDCVYTPAPAKLLSERVTKGLCEMAPLTREEPAAEPAHPVLQAVFRSDDEVRHDELTGPTTDLKATVDPEDLGATPAFAPGPVELSVQRIDTDDVGEVPLGPATLDAVLVNG